MPVPITQEKHLQHIKEDGGYTADFYGDVPVYTKGSILIEICNKCSYLSATCNHSNNSWNKEETILTCDLCGSDGT